MRRAVYTEFGDSSVLRVVEADVPTPGPGEVLVRLHRSGVNPTDWKVRSGVNPRKEFDEISPGQDGAGVVAAVGRADASASSVETPFAVGDRVWLFMVQNGRPHGTAGEYVTAPVERVSALPESASFDLGASLGVPAITAWRALTSGEGATRLAPGALAGRTVLVQGGAGAVGNAAIQLARWAGATVVTTVSSPAKAALASAAGAHHVVNYREGDAVQAILALAPEGVDLVVEVAPAVNNDLDRAVVRSRGTIAIYANNGGDTITMPVRETFSKNLRYQFVYEYELRELLASAAEDVTAAIAAGGLGVGEDRGLPLHHHSLDDVAAAHDEVQAGVVGKVLLDLA